MSILKREVIHEAPGDELVPLEALTPEVAPEVIEGEIVDVYTEYDSNNSGGSWWLSDQNWIDLEAAGWHVEWGGRAYGGEVPAKSAEDAAKNRYMGALAVSATRDLPITLAIQEWERITGDSASDEGCGCCGPPHSFAEYDRQTKQQTRSAYISTNPTLEIS